MELRELDGLPALPPLYAKAALGPLVPGGGDQLPDHALGVRELEIDPEHVAEYARVCGFALRETVPVTYPHLLGFPLEMGLMTERGFPFALLGMVHVGNRIQQRRPISLGERPAVKVWAEGLRPHRKGRQLDMVTEVSVGGEVVWTEWSNYLRPGGGGEDEGSNADNAQREEREARLARAPTSAVWKVPGDIGRRYASVSGDRNPIHLSGLSARPFGFKGAIAHGMWSQARCLAAFDGTLPATFETSVEFSAPLPTGARARFATVGHDGGRDYALTSPDGNRRHLTGWISPG
jgi:acyl dehydratase